ncbi:hypothetical protein MKX08_005794 [Trichoderma sp. CBMAI-0020]|nr:hypothetical protein MKX08_005794 [Trichoderma sp. CBMAI-0020]
MPRLNINRHGHRWNANAGEIEAALSLRLFYVKSFERKSLSAADVIHKRSDVSDDEWLRIKGKVSEFGIRVLGHRTVPRLRQLTWWMPPNGPKILRVQDSPNCDPTNTSNGKRIEAIESVYAGSSNYEVVEIDDSRAFGFFQCIQQRKNDQRQDGASCHQELQLSHFRNSEKSQWRFKISKEEIACGEDSHIEEINGCLMAISCHDSLEFLYAKDLFSTFIWDISKSLKRHIGGKTSIRAQADEGRDSWKKFTLHNDTISRLCQVIQGTGLYNSGEALVSIISPLCDQQKLPTAQCIVDLARSRANEFERQRDWRSACKVYLWLDARKDTFGVESYAYAKVVALVIAFRNTVLDRAKQRADEGISKTEMPQVLMDDLENSIQSADRTLSGCLTTFSEFRDDNGRGKYASDVSRYIASKYQRPLFIQAKVFEAAFLSHLQRPEQKWAKEDLKTDVFYRTLLHYDAAFTHDADSRVQLWRGTERWEFPGDVQSSHLFYLMIESLIDAGIPMDGGDVHGWAPLHYACRAGNVSMARLLLEKCASPDVQGLDGTAPIHVAARGGHLKMIEILVGFKADIDIADGMGKTALHHAAFCGYEETVELLCRHDSQGLRDRWGRTALHVASLCGHDNFVQRLLDIPGLEINALDKLEQTPIHLAVEAGCTLAVEYLIKGGINVDAQDGKGQTPLHRACKGGRNGVVDALVDAHAAPDVETKGRETPLHCAAHAQKNSIAKLLVKSKCNVDIEDRNGHTPLYLTIETGDLAMAKAILQPEGDDPDEASLAARARVNTTTSGSGGSTLLHSAVRFRRREHARLLAGYGANMEARDSKDRTPLHLAIQQPELQEPDAELIRELIGLGADVNATTVCHDIGNNGSTPLHLAARADGPAEMIEGLLWAGAQIDQADEDGYTPLHMAAAGNHVANIEMLIESGANVNALCNDGKTPEMLADGNRLGWWAANTAAFQGVTIGSP